MNFVFSIKQFCILLPAPLWYLICTMCLKWWRNALFLVLFRTNFNYIWCKCSIIIFFQLWSQNCIFWYCYFGEQVSNISTKAKIKGSKKRKDSKFWYICNWSSRKARLLITNFATFSPFLFPSYLRREEKRGRE